MEKLKNKYASLSNPAKTAVWFTICNLLLKGISFITVPIFTRMLTDEEYGILSLFLSYEQIIMIFATWEIQMGAYQKGIFNYKNDISIFTTSTLALINIITVCVYVVLTIAHEWIYTVTGMSTAILVLMFVYMIVQPAYNCWMVRKRTAFEYKSAVAMTLVYSLLNVFGPMIALVLVRRTAYVKIGSTLVLSTAICMFFYIPYAKFWKLKGKIETVKQHWKFLIQFEGPLVLHSLSYLILSQADRIMIGNMVGKAEAAYYSIAYSLGNVVSLVQSSINQSLLPWRYQMLEEKRYDEIKKNTNILLIGIGAIILLFVLVAPEIMKILFTENYYEAVWSIPPIAASVYFMFLYTVFVNIESYFEKTKYVMYVSVSCGIINIVLNYVCIGYFGYIVCGYTTLISYILFSLGHYYFMRNIIKHEAPEARVIDCRSIVGISITLMVLSVIFTLLYNYFVVRYVMLIFMLGFVIIYKEKIISVFMKMKK